MKQSGHLNPSKETGTGYPVTSKYRTPPNKHGGVVRQQQYNNIIKALYIMYSVRLLFYNALIMSMVSSFNNILCSGNCELSSTIYIH